MTTMTRADRDTARIFAALHDAYTVSDQAALATADRHVTLKARGKSSRVQADALTGSTYAPSADYIARIIRIRKALPADVSPVDFAAAVTAEKAERAAKQAARNQAVKDKAAAAVALEQAAEGVVTGDSAPVVTADVDSAIRTLWDIVEQHGGDPRLVAALSDALSYVSEPVAA